MLYKMPWGDSEIQVPVPDSWKLCAELIPDAYEIRSEPQKLLADALAHPYNSVRLSEMDLHDKKVCVVIDDGTRPTPVAFLFAAVREELHAAGVSDKQINILAAVGTHAAMSEEAIRKRLGVEDLSVFADVRNNNAYEADEMEYLGTTPGGMVSSLNRKLTGADLVVLIGTIEPHLLAGFGGGLKNVLPGCAAAETIAFTHLNGPATERYYNVGKMGEDVLSRINLEAASLMYKGRYFVVNTVLTHEEEIVGIFCGDPVVAHRAGCALASDVYCARVPERSDVLIVNSNPIDYDLRQGSKCFLLSHDALKEGGVLIACLRCRIGVGDMDIREGVMSPGMTKLLAQKLGAEAVVTLREELQGEFSADEKFMNQLMVEVARKYHLLVYSPDIPMEVGAKIGAFELYHDLDAVMARAQELAPQNASFSLAPSSSIVYAKCIN